MKHIRSAFGIILIFALLLVPLAACSSGKSSSGAQARGWNGSTQGWGTRSGRQNKGSGSGESGWSAGGGGASGQTQILGKVTSIVGNEVTLAVGTQSGSDSSATSSGLTLTGESKTLLIPVGLTLSTSGGAGRTGAWGASGSAASGGGNPGGGAPPEGGMPGSGNTGNTRNAGAVRTGSTSGSRTSGISGRSGAGTSTTRSSDFSSITKGMVLRVTQRDVNGTAMVVRVSVVSK